MCSSMCKLPPNTMLGFSVGQPFSHAALVNFLERNELDWGSFCWAVLKTFMRSDGDHAIQGKRESDANVRAKAVQCLCSHCFAH